MTVYVGKEGGGELHVKHTHSRRKCIVQEITVGRLQSNGGGARWRPMATPVLPAAKRGQALAAICPARQ